MRGNSPLSETADRELLREAERKLAALLPPTWDVELEAGPPEIDGYFVVRSPQGAVARFLVEAKAGQIAGSAAMVSRALMLARTTALAPLVVTSYAGAALRRMCEENDVNYLDLTGWAWIRADSPAIALMTTGAERDPRPARPATITRLNGAGAGRAIRALLDSRGPGGVRALAERAEVTPGTVSKLLKALDAEAVVERGPTGQILSIRKRDLVERWTRDYKFLRTNRVGWFLAPRGVRQAVERAATGDPNLVATGSVALRRYLPDQQVPITALSQFAAYVPDLDDGSRLLGLVPTDRATANVILAVPYDPRLLDIRPTADDRLSVVDVGQTVADLMTLPGRAPEEADQLMRVLAAGDRAWS